jgi:Domain of unknown function (DUF4279)
MPHIHASLFVRGDDLNFEAVTRVLGIEADYESHKEDPDRQRYLRPPFNAQYLFDTWRLTSDEDFEETELAGMDANDHIHHVLSLIEWNDERADFLKNIPSRAGEHLVTVLFGVEGTQSNTNIHFNLIRLIAKLGFALSIDCWRTEDFKSDELTLQSYVAYGGFKSAVQFGGGRDAAAHVQELSNLLDAANHSVQPRDNLDFYSTSTSPNMDVHFSNSTLKTMAQWGVGLNLHNWYEEVLLPSGAA